MEKAQTTAIILSWNTLSVVKDSLRRLKRECPVIVVDNGSTDGSREYFESYSDPNVKFILLDENKGNCIARNLALRATTTPYFFLIDGDILYVPNSIKILEEIIGKYPECGCVGVHNEINVRKYGFNGTPNILEASLKAVAPQTVYKGFPMAWTQYGLFRKTGQEFIEKAPFDTAGHGYEDDYWFREMKKKGLDSYFITEPLYYHEAHSGKREIAKLGLPDREDERRKAYQDRWGESWLTQLFTVEQV